MHATWDRLASFTNGLGPKSKHALSMVSVKGGLIMGVSSSRESVKTNKGKDFKRHGLDLLYLVIILGHLYGHIKVHDNLFHGVCGMDRIKLQKARWVQAQLCIQLHYHG